MPKARQVARALERSGWAINRQRGSHRQFVKGGETRTFAYHDSAELGAVQLRKIAAQFGLTLDELRAAL